MIFANSLQKKIEKARLLQSKLAEKIKIRPLRLDKGIIAGIDVSYRNEFMFCAIVLLNFPSLRIADIYSDKKKVDFPYIPGFLSFRELPVILKTFKQVKEKVSLIFCDGQGIAHPRGFGLASHIGSVLNIPSIGCAKSRLIGTYKEPGIKKGSYSDLIYNEKIVGAVVRTRDNCQPIFVSPGNCIDIESSVKYVLMTSRFRIPEPTRLAHIYVTRLKFQK